MLGSVSPLAFLTVKKYVLVETKVTYIIILVKCGVTYLDDCCCNHDMVGEVIAL